MVQETKAAKTESTAHLFAVNLLEKLVEFLKKIMTSNLLGFCIKWLTKIGHFGIIVAAALGFLFALIFAIRSNQFDIFLYAIGWVLLIFVAQYTAHKFLPAGDKLIQNNPTQLSSKNFLDCFGFLVLIGGVIVLIIQIVMAIRFGRFEHFLWGLGVFLFLEFLALVSFNPDDINLKIVGTGSAGREAIGIITFFIKGLMRLVPIFFGIFIVIGTIMLFIDFIGIFGDRMGWAWRNGFESASDILSAALLPFISYILFALLYLVIDLIQAILSIPEPERR